MLEPALIVVIVVVFILAGLVKGVIGLGLPTISLTLLTITTDLPSAMALLLVPSLTTNVWQMVDGGNCALVFKRIWPFLAGAVITVWIGGLALTRVDSSSLTNLLGGLIIAYSVFAMVGFKPTLTKKSEMWAGPVVGAINGVLTGMTGSFVFPGIVFLQSIDLPRNALIQAMGMLFTASTLALALSLNHSGLITLELGLLSILGVAPALFGMRLGRQLRQQLSEKHFKNAFYCALLVIGLYLMV